MINTVNKGRRNEAKTRKYLENKGFKVCNTVRSSYRGGQNDFFGLFDHIAVRLSDGEVFLIQTKSNRLPTKSYLLDIAVFPAKNKLLFIWYDRNKTPEIIKL